MLKINDDYYLKTDRLQYILCKKLRGKKKCYFRNIGYFGSIISLKQYLLEHEIKCNLQLLTSINEVIKIKNELGKISND